MRYCDIIESIVLRQSSAIDPQKTFPVFKNGSRSNVAYIRQNFPVPDDHIRGLLDALGDLYFWDAYGGVHFAITNALSLPRPCLHLELLDDEIVVCQQRGAFSDPITTEDLHNVGNNRYIQRIYGRDPHVRIR